MEKDVQSVYKCVDCEAISEDAGSALYECNECGTRFNRENSADGGSHRCPDCNRFASKVADESCCECEEGEVIETEAWFCEECSEWVEADATDHPVHDEE